MVKVVSDILELVLHLDKHLVWVFGHYGLWTYGVLFLIIFCETGLVITPFLPGDSLLFTVGAFAGTGTLNVWVLMVMLSLAAVAGDTLNYWVGHHVGKRAFKAKWVNQEYLRRAESFYERHGGKTIVVARFVPIIRTFAPFVAGIGRMSYVRFVTYNVVGGVVWVGSLIGAGYLFGNIPAVQEHFSWVILGILIVSFIPVGVEWIRHRLHRGRPDQRGRGGFS